MTINAVSSNIAKITFYICMCIYSKVCKCLDSDRVLVNRKLVAQWYLGQMRPKYNFLARFERGLCLKKHPTYGEIHWNGLKAER